VRVYPRVRLPRACPSQRLTALRVYPRVRLPRACPSQRLTASRVQDTIAEILKASKPTASSSRDTPRSPSPDSSGSSSPVAKRSKPRSALRVDIVAAVTVSGVPWTSDQLAQLDQPAAASAAGYSADGSSSAAAASALPGEPPAPFDAHELFRKFLCSQDSLSSEETAELRAILLAKYQALPSNHGAIGVFLLGLPQLDPLAGALCLESVVMAVLRDVFKKELPPRFAHGLMDNFNVLFDPDFPLDMLEIMQQLIDYRAQAFSQGVGIAVLDTASATYMLVVNLVRTSLFPNPPSTRA
jgi:hypothetical protein